MRQSALIITLRFARIDSAAGALWDWFVLGHSDGVK